jgi:hypothetical protein
MYCQSLWPREISTLEKWLTWDTRNFLFRRGKNLLHPFFWSWTVLAYVSRQSLSNIKGIKYSSCKKKKHFNVKRGDGKVKVHSTSCQNT